VAATLNSGRSSGSVARAIPVDVSSWESQLKAFELVLGDSERIDFVFPIAGIGERSWITNNTSIIDFAKPDLTVFDVDVYGVLYTVSLAIQQFRRQSKDQDGYKGKSESWQRRVS
jgi:NAD(P)-dependent dehydrogenase (short-subunit alcohol dehydrogenase family)